MMITILLFLALGALWIISISLISDHITDAKKWDLEFTKIEKLLMKLMGPITIIIMILIYFININIHRKK